MKALPLRALASTFLGALALLLVLGARNATKTAPIAQPDTLVIVSTSDVKGEVDPCG
jgi:hypothetical protein